MILNCERGLLAPVNVSTSTSSGASRRARTSFKIRPELITELNINPPLWGCTWKGRMTGENSISNLWGIVKQSLKQQWLCQNPAPCWQRYFALFNTVKPSPSAPGNTKELPFFQHSRLLQAGPKVQKDFVQVSSLPHILLKAPAPRDRLFPFWFYVEIGFYPSWLKEINLKAWPFLPPWKLVGQIRLPQTVSLI